MVTPKDVLTRAHDLLGEYGICRGAYGLDENGNSVPSSDPRARSFCSVGAVSRAVIDLCGRWDPSLATESHQVLGQHINAPPGQITNWNDELATDEEILATFRKAAGLPEPTKPVEASEPVLVAA